MKLRILDPFVIVYAWVMACATIICGGKRGKEYPPLGDPRIMRRAINFFFSLPPQSYAIVLADSRKSIIIHRRLFHRMEYAFFHFTRSFFPSDISMVKSNFSPLDSHRLTYGQRGGEGRVVERFPFEFQSLRPVLRPGFYIPTPSSRFIGTAHSILSNFNECSTDSSRSSRTIINRWDQDQDERYVRTFV